MHSSDRSHQGWHNPSSTTFSAEEEELLDDDTSDDADDSEPRVISNVSREPSIALVPSNGPVAPSRLRTIAGLGNIISAATSPAGQSVSILYIAVGMTVFKS